MAAARRALRVSRAAEPLDDHGKDERLGELLQLAAMRGHGDLDLERARRALEAVSWDVSRAFDSERLCSGRRARAVPVDRPRGGGRLADQRLQRRGGGADSSDGSDDATEFEMLQRREQQDIQDAMRLSSDAMRRSSEADLQDAIRRSFDDSYSGSFSVPPVDEAVLQAVTKTSQHQSCDATGQCSVCLMDFEHGDSLRTMQCCHSFHMVCVDQWLAQSGSCPVCKTTVGGIELACIQRIDCEDRQVDAITISWLAFKGLIVRIFKGLILRRPHLLHH